MSRCKCSNTLTQQRAGYPQHLERNAAAPPSASVPAGRRHHTAPNGNATVNPRCSHSSVHANTTLTKRHSCTSGVVAAPVLCGPWAPGQMQHSTSLAAPCNAGQISQSSNPVLLNQGNVHFLNEAYLAGLVHDANRSSRLQSIVQCGGGAEAVWKNSEHIGSQTTMLPRKPSGGHVKHLQESSSQMSLQHAQNQCQSKGQASE